MTFAHTTLFKAFQQYQNHNKRPHVLRGVNTIINNQHKIKQTSILIYKYPIYWSQIRVLSKIRNKKSMIVVYMRFNYKTSSLPSCRPNISCSNPFLMSQPNRRLCLQNSSMPLSCRVIQPWERSHLRDMVVVTQNWVGSTSKFTSFLGTLPSDSLQCFGQTVSSAGR
jgi:hypothetical protein